MAGMPVTHGFRILSAHNEESEVVIIHGKLLCKLAALSAVALEVIFSGPAVGATYTGNGTIYALVINDSSWGADADYLTVNGVASLGTCPTMNGLVVLMLKDDSKAQRMFAALLAAKTAGTPVTIDADDTYRSTQGYCYLRHVI
jgi:hypothetical protein